MAKGKSLYRSVKLETPEIVKDLRRIACALPEYVNGVGNVTKMVMFDGSWENRDYTAGYWALRFTKFHGESEKMLSEIGEFLGRHRNIPVPVGNTVLVPVKIRKYERVQGDGTMGYFMLDQIREVVPPTYLTQLDNTFFDRYSYAKCAILLWSGTLIPCVQAYNKVAANHRDGLMVQRFMQDKEKEVALSRSGLHAEHGPYHKKYLEPQYSQQLEPPSGNYRMCAEGSEEYDTKFVNVLLSN